MFYVLQSTVHRYIVNSCFDYNYSKWNNFPLSPPDLTYLQVTETIKGILSIRQKHIILVSQLAAPDREKKSMPFPKLQIIPSHVPHNAFPGVDKEGEGPDGHLT